MCQHFLCVACSSQQQQKVNDAQCTRDAREDLYFFSRRVMNGQLVWLPCSFPVAVAPSNMRSPKNHTHQHLRVNVVHKYTLERNSQIDTFRRISEHVDLTHLASNRNNLFIWKRRTEVYHVNPHLFVVTFYCYLCAAAAANALYIFVLGVTKRLRPVTATQLFNTRILYLCMCRKYKIKLSTQH
jgi:hypothetical protein